VHLPDEPCAAALARAVVLGLIQRAGMLDQDGDALLMTSEVVTNAIQHARQTHRDEPRSIMLDARVTSDQLRVEVHDPDQHGPELTNAGPTATHGRGLMIVQALAKEWGVVRTGPSGKTVWFTLALEREGPA
jgi:anti-sigma regulatory factor (Ser/Thr protein kinase)